jgi:ribonuclease HI
MSSRLITAGAYQGNPCPGGWADRLTGDDLPSHNLQGAGSEVNTTNTCMALMAVLEGVKSIPSGSEVKVVTSSTDVITVAAHRNLKLMNRDLVLALGAELAEVRATVLHVYSYRGAPEQDLVDRLVSAGTQGRIGC